MMPLQNTCTKIAITPKSYSAAGTVTAYVDTLGYQEAAIDVIMDSQAATTSNLAVLTIGEGDTSTANTAISGLTGDATDGFTIPATQTTPGVTRINVDLRGRKRWLSLDITAGDVAVILCATVTLGKANDSTTARAAMAGVVDA